MKPEKIRIKVAMAMGWRRFGIYSKCASGKQLLGMADAILHGTPPEDGDKTEDDHRYLPVPNYPEDLNAWPTIIAQMTEAQLRTFTGHVLEIVRGRHPEKLFTMTHEMFMALATAGDYSQSYLRTIGQWEDGE